jgi:hypothetical protein
MKIIITTILLTTNLLISGGCAVIGIETLSSSGDQEFTHFPLNKSTVVYGKMPIRISTNAVWIISGLPAKRTPKSTVQTKDDVIRKLGKPDKEKDDYIFYSSKEKVWRGFAIDVAIMLPISLPLAVPTGKAGIKFWHDQNGNILRATGCWTMPTFYGYYINCGGQYFGKEEGFSIWFEE